MNWKLITVKASQIKPNPNNPKIRDEKGFTRLQKSLSKFGTIFDGICNKDLSLIDGHSRLELKQPGDLVTVFVPDKQLTKKDEAELNAIFDLAKAGDTDWGKLKENFEEFDLSIEDWELMLPEIEDFSEKNKEINTEGFDDNMTIKLQYTEAEYHIVRDGLAKISSTPERAVWKLLGNA